LEVGIFSVQKSLIAESIQNLGERARWSAAIYAASPRVPKQLTCPREAMLGRALSLCGHAHRKRPKLRIAEESTTSGKVRPFFHSQRVLPFTAK